LAINHREVTCKNYKQCSTNTDYRSYVECVQYKDLSPNNNNNPNNPSGYINNSNLTNITYQIKPLKGFSNQVTNLPQSCWTNNENVMFYSPGKIIGYSTLFVVCFVVIYFFVLYLTPKLKNIVQQMNNPTVISGRGSLYSEQTYMQMQQV
jgi:hypothetical protein